MGKVLLVSMPWAAVNRPALGVSLLKAILSRASIPCDVTYPSLRWWELFLEYTKGAGSGAALSDGAQEQLLEETRLAMADEWVFSQCLYGRDAPDSSTYVHERLAHRLSPAEIEKWLGLRDVAERFLQETLAAIPWADYDLVGFTSTFRQHLASLCLAQRVKARWPQARIAFGGANCERAMGAALMRNFGFVDYVADGEADHSLVPLVQSLRAGKSPDGIKGILWRDGERIVNNGPPDVVRDLDVLPFPDFDDYFAQLARHSFKDKLEVRLPLEGSRGCWWGQRRPCTFCGLNGAIREYRAKSPNRLVAEAHHILDRYASSYIVYTDNVLDFRRFREVLPRLSRRAPGQVSFFFEIRSSFRKAELRALRRAGAWAVQPGVESLSTRLLKLMNKGVTALQNVRCLKWCHQYSIRPGWNLLYGFPGERPADYAGMMPLLRAITHFEPPKAVGRIRLDRFSPNFCEAAPRGFTNVRPATPYRFLYRLPERELADLAYHFDYDYADGHDPNACVAEVKAFVADWKTRPRGDLIHFRLDAGRGRILDTRYNRVVDRLELDPLENDLYERCDAIRSLADLSGFLSQKHPEAFTETRLRAALERFLDCQMMVRERTRYLAVALSDALAADEAPTEERDWLAIVA